MRACCFPSIPLEKKQNQNTQARQRGHPEHKRTHAQCGDKNRDEQQPTWKKPGGMGPPGIPSFGGMFPSTGLGAAAALCGEQNQDRHGGFELELRKKTH